MITPHNVDIDSLFMFSFQIKLSVEKIQFFFKTFDVSSQVLV